MKLILLGPPGSGKGTVASRLAKEFNLLHLCTGDLFREEISKKTKLGQLADHHISQGHLVPDEITLKLVQNKITSSSNQNIVFDGFPRTLAQAKGMEKFTKIDLVISLEVSEKIAIERISLRRTCQKCAAIYHLKYIPPKKPDTCDQCGHPLIQRSDEKEAVVKERFEVYHQQSKPLIKHYQNKGLLQTINGEPLPDEVYRQVREIVKKFIQ